MLLNKNIFVFTVTIFPILSSIADMDISKRIIKGKRAKLGQFPWAVLLKHPDSDASACGASIISSEWVLSAGHCGVNVKKIVLIFGTVDLNNPIVPNMTSDKIYLHDGYKYGDLKDDISLIKLPKPVEFTDNIKAIALPPVSFETDAFVNDEAVTCGFGLRDDTTYKYPKHLWYITVTIISNKECTSKLIQPIPEEILCVQGKGKNHKASVCQGDSGSALVLKDENGEYMQIGVTSFAVETQCEEGYPTGFARVTDYLEWINNITGIELRK